MRILLFCAILAAQHCIAFEQSSEDSTGHFCEGSTFVGFKQFTLSRKMKLQATTTTYSRSRHFLGFPRIGELYVQGSNEALKNSLPEIAKKYTNTYPTPDSKANCFNATLNWFRNTTDLRKSYIPEIDAYLSENFVELKDGSEIIQGDVLYLYMPIDDGIKFRLKAFHTAVYIDSNIFWHKASDDPEDPWTFEDLTLQLQNFCEKSEGQMLVKFFRKKTAQ